VTRLPHASALVALALAACTAAADDPVAASSAAIVNGSFDSGDLQVVALTSSVGRVICTGTLVSSRVVLTAGHCSYDITPYYAYFGSSTPFLPGARVRVTRAIANPDYDPTSFRRADVGLVILKDRAPVAPLLWNDQPLDASYVGGQIRIVGFGFQQTADVVDRRIGDKMTIRLPILQLVQTEEYEYLQGTCNGDSGGPQLYTFPDGVERVIGVTSYGIGGCGGVSGAHRVDPYDAWIRAEIAAFDPPSCARDYRCVSGCADIDPDCPCAADDGRCSATCEDPASDPDCPIGCGAGDTCVHACPAPDPDCGDPCVAEGHCVKDCPRRDPDCAAPGDAGDACASDFDCATGTACLTPLPGDSTVCTPTCLPEIGCSADLECRAINQTTSACLPKNGRLLSFVRADGCRVAPGRAGDRTRAWPLLGLLVLCITRPRRRPR
jgi:hypothetical protein